MKKALIVGVVFLVVIFLSVSAYGIGGWGLHQRLKLLLNDETIPFFPDSIRTDFLVMGLKKCATLCNQVGRFRKEWYAPQSTTYPYKVLAFGLDGIFSATTPITNIDAVWLKDTTYALMEIKGKDVAQKKIATSEESRYWYERYRSATSILLAVYPPPADSTPLWIFGSCAPLWSDTSLLNPGFENEVVLYALYLCKQRQGEIEVANFIRQIAINEILDLKAILENRPMDVTLAKEVVPR